MARGGRALRSCGPASFAFRLISRAGENPDAFQIDTLKLTARVRRTRSEMPELKLVVE